jgi:hypothetical protein
MQDPRIEDDASSTWRSEKRGSELVRLGAEIVDLGSRKDSVAYLTLLYILHSIRGLTVDTQNPEAPISTVLAQQVASVVPTQPD